LVDKGMTDTLILFHHHDTVDLEDYGPMGDLVLDLILLARALQEQDLRPDLQADLTSGDWMCGRGACDMKAVLALQLGVLDTYSQDGAGQANLFFLSVGYEESYSRGMRAGVTLLVDLRQRFNLRYCLAIDSEPFESSDRDKAVLNIGTVGKIMPVVVIQGILIHMKEPLKGVDALSLLIQLDLTLDLNPALTDQAV
jgi:M20A subfamily peptidase